HHGDVRAGGLDAVTDDALCVVAVAPPLHAARDLLDLARQLLAFRRVDHERGLRLDQRPVRTQLRRRLAVALGRARHGFAQRGARVDGVCLDQDGAEEEDEHRSSFGSGRGCERRHVHDGPPSPSAARTPPAYARGAPGVSAGPDPWRGVRAASFDLLNAWMAASGTPITMAATRSTPRS